jgi:hypothetical protein
MLVAVPVGLMLGQSRSSAAHLADCHSLSRPQDRLPADHSALWASATRPFFHHFPILFFRSRWSRSCQ